MRKGPECGSWCRNAVQLALIGILLAASVSCGVSRSYTAEPIAGVVIDAETKRPIEGVSVVAAWEAKGGLEGGNIVGVVMLMEDVTNAKGEYALPGWGPKRWWRGRIKSEAPRLVFFKPGYDLVVLRERKYILEQAPSHLVSSWNGKTIEMTAFHGSENEYSLRLSELGTLLGTLSLDDRCVLEVTPRFFEAIKKQHLRFREAGALSSVSGYQTLEEDARKLCTTRGTSRQ